MTLPGDEDDSIEDFLAQLHGEPSKELATAPLAPPKPVLPEVPGPIKITEKKDPSKTRPKEEPKTPLEEDTKPLLGAASFIGDWVGSFRDINVVQIETVMVGDRKVFRTSGYNMRQEKGKPAIRTPFTTWDEVGETRARYYLSFLGEIPAGRPTIHTRVN